MYHGIHTENEQFYLEAQKALHICPSLQHYHAESFPISSSALPPWHRLLDHQVAKEALPRRSKVRILAERIKN